MVLKKLNDFINDGRVEDFSENGTPYYFDGESTPINYSRLVPGYVYTFVSKHQINNDSIPSLDEYQTTGRTKKPYFDRRPLFVSLGQEGPMEIGINLKLMPINFRKWFLRKYLKILYHVIEKMVDKDGKLIELNKRMRMQESAPLYKFNRSFATMVGEQTGFNVEFLVDKYTRGEMGNPLALIDWDQVPKLSSLLYMNDGSIISKTPISYFLTKFT